MKPPINRRQLVQTAAVGLLPFGAQAAPAKSTGWTIYGGDQEATLFTAQPDYQRQSFQAPGRLGAPRSSRSCRNRGSVECTPLIVDGVMYIIGAGLVIQALDAATGKLLWTHAPLSGGSQRRAQGVSRGLTYWKDGERERLRARSEQNPLPEC